MALHPLPLSGPAVLRIAADVLRAPTDYVDDHIWEVIPGGDPPGLAAATSYGRRAAAMRIFPSFGMGGPVIADPAAFERPPVLEAILPSYLRLVFAPLPGLEVGFELRAVDSQTVAGRVTLTNATDRFRPVRLGLHAHLLPLPEGRPMVPGMFTGVIALAGKSASLAPVVFLAGGASAEPGRVPSLTVQTELAPGAGRSYTWAESASSDAAVSFERARGAAGQAWEAEVARLERIHAGWVEVHSGDEAWDAAFHLGQQSALNGFVGPAPLSIRPTLVVQRSPERGHSPSGDGRDHGEGWDGPSALEAYYVIRQMVYAAPELAAEVLRAFWASQRPDGTIDARPGPAGQLSRLPCPPLLASLTLDVDRRLQDAEFLEEGFRALWPFFRTWFRPSSDRDGDGWPEWDHRSQVPWPVHWVRRGELEPLEPWRVEDPGLLALLYREAEVLERMAERLGRGEAGRELADRRRQLRGLLARAWSEERLTFLRLDRESHRSPTGETLAHGTGTEKVRVGRSLPAPARLGITIVGQFAASGSLRVRLRGRVESGRVRVETKTAADLRQGPDSLRCATDLLFNSVESIEVTGAPDEVPWRVAVAPLDFEDLSLLLPLWAGMVEPAQAEQIVRRLTGPNGYLRRAGLAPEPGEPPESIDAADPDQGVWLPLNLLLGEGLLRYGFIQQAEDLLSRMMAGVVESLRGSHALRQGVHPDSLAGLGQRHHLAGLPPLSLYLDLLGVGLETPRRVRLAAGREIVRPGLVRWRGLEVRRDGPAAWLTFPSGATSHPTVTEDIYVEETSEPPL